MKPLQKLWPAIENVAGMKAVLAEWRRQLGPDFDLTAPLLHPTDTHAESYPVADDPYASYRVISRGPNVIVGVHDGGRPTIALTKQEVLIYGMDLRRIRRAVAAALGFEVLEATVDDVPHTSRIGTFCPFAGFAFPVYLVVPLEAADLLLAVEVVSS